MSFRRQSLFTGLPRKRPVYWYQICKFTCPSSYQPPNDSRDCENWKCIFGPTCWYGHHGEEYTDAPGEANTFIRGTSIYYDKYPRADIRKDHKEKHFYRKGDPTKVFTGAWRKRNSISSTEDERIVAPLPKLSPNNKGLQPSKTQPSQSSRDSCNITLAKCAKRDGHINAGVDLIGNASQKLQPTVAVRSEISHRSALMEKTSERGFAKRIQTQTKNGTCSPNARRDSSNRQSFSTQLAPSILTALITRTNSSNLSMLSLTPRQTLKNRTGTNNQGVPREAAYQNATFFQPNRDPYEALPTYIREPFRFPEQVFMRLPSLLSDGKQSPTKASIVKGTTSSMTKRLEENSYECGLDFEGFVKDRALEGPGNKPNVYLGYIMQVIENLEAPPPMVAFVKEYLARLTVQARHDRSNKRMKFQQLYYGLDDKEVEGSFMYRKMVEEILESVNALPVSGRNQFRKNAMLGWFGRRYKGSLKVENFTTEQSLSCWKTGSYLSRMKEFFVSQQFSRYLTSMHNYLLFLQIQLTKTWRRIGPLFHKEWSSPEIGSIGRYAILTRALGSKGVDSEWEEFDYGYPKATGLGTQKRPPSERAEWVIELYPDPLAQDPELLFRLVAQVLHTEDWKTGSLKASQAYYFTHNDVPIFPSPPDFLFSMLPREITEEYLAHELSNASSHESENPFCGIVEEKHSHPSGISNYLSFSPLAKALHGSIKANNTAKDLRSAPNTNSQASTDTTIKEVESSTAQGSENAVTRNAVKPNSNDIRQNETGTPPKGRNRDESLSKLRHCVVTAHRRKSSAASTRPQLRLNTDIAGSTTVSSPDDTVRSTASEISATVSAFDSPLQSRRPSLAIASSNANEKHRQVIPDGIQQSDVDPDSTEGKPASKKSDLRDLAPAGLSTTTGTFHRKTLSRIPESLREELNGSIDVFRSETKTIKPEGNGAKEDDVNEKDRLQMEATVLTFAPKKLSYAEMAALDPIERRPAQPQLGSEVIKTQPHLVTTSFGDFKIRMAPTIVKANGMHGATARSYAGGRRTEIGQAMYASNERGIPNSSAKSLPNEKSRTADEPETVCGTVGTTSSVVAIDNNTTRAKTRNGTDDTDERISGKPGMPKLEAANLKLSGLSKAASSFVPSPVQCTDASKKKKPTRTIRVPFNVKPKVIQNPTIDAIFSMHMVAMEDSFDYKDLPLLRYMEMISYDRTIFITKTLMSILKVWEETRRGEIYYNPTVENMQSAGSAKVTVKQEEGFNNGRFNDVQRLELAGFFRKLEQYMDAFGLGVRFVEEGSNDERMKRENEGGFTVLEGGKPPCR